MRIDEGTFAGLRTAPMIGGNAIAGHSQRTNDRQANRFPVRSGSLHAARRTGEKACSAPAMAIVGIRRALSEAWRLTLTLQDEKTHAKIEEIEALLTAIPAKAARIVRGSIKALKAIELALQDHWEAALILADAPSARQGSQCQAQTLRTLQRLGLWKLGDRDAFLALPRRRPIAVPTGLETISAVFDLSIEAAFAIDCLQFASAKRIAMDALALLQTAETIEPEISEQLAILPISLLAQVHHEEGNFEEAERLLQTCFPRILEAGSIEAALRTCVVLARIARQRGQYDLAGIILGNGERLGERRGWKRLVETCACERISLLVEAGCPEEAKAILDHQLSPLVSRLTDLGSYPNDHGLLGALMQCQWAVSGGFLLYLMADQKRIDRTIRASGSPYAACLVTVDLAVLFFYEGDLNKADALFRQALKSAVPAGFSRPFMRQSSAIGVLLERAYDWLDQSHVDREILPVVGSLLSQWRVLKEALRSTAVTRTVANSLSVREADVLEQICHGQTNKSIARSLGISPETVKSHMKRIFIKLSVNTRSEAVARIKALGSL